MIQIAPQTSTNRSGRIDGAEADDIPAEMFGRWRAKRIAELEAMHAPMVEESPYAHKNGKPVLINGVRYESVSEAATTLRVNLTSIYGVMHGIKRRIRVNGVLKEFRVELICNPAKAR